MRIIMNFIELEKYFIMAFGLGLAIIEGLLYFKYTKQPKKTFIYGDWAILDVFYDLFYM